MITESNIYWITRLDNLICLCNVIITLGILVIIGSIFVRLFFVEKYQNITTNSEYNYKLQEYYKYIKYSTISFWLSLGIWIIAIIGTIFIPTTKEMAFIKIVPIIAANENIEELSTDSKKIMKLMVKYIENQIQILPEQEEENVKKWKKN